MISTQLQRLIDAKADIREAIKNKGVKVNDSIPLDDYADYIDRIEVDGATREVEFEPIINTITPSNPHKMSGFNVWTDGVNIYYSGGNNLHYKLISETDTELVWEKMTWGAFNNFSGNNVWSDGTSIYYSSGTTHYELDKENLNWIEKSWSGLTNFNGHAVWTDGTDFYYCLGAASNRYVLDKETSTWSSVADKWSGLANIFGYYLFSDGTDTYHAIIQLVSGGFSYTTVLHKLDGTKFTQLNPNFNFASTAGFNGATLWKYKDKIRSCDLGPMIFDPESATIIPDKPYTTNSFIGVGYMFTTTPNKNIKLNLRASTFGMDKDVDYGSSNVYSLFNGQCYKLKHNVELATQSDDDEDLSLMSDDEPLVKGDEYQYHNTTYRYGYYYYYNGYLYNDDRCLRRYDFDPCHYYNATLKQVHGRWVIAFDDSPYTLLACPPVSEQLLTSKLGELYEHTVKVCGLLRDGEPWFEDDTVEDESNSIYLLINHIYYCDDNSLHPNDPFGTITVDSNYVYNDNVTYNNGLTDFDFTWYRDVLSVTATVKTENIKLVYDTENIDLTFSCSDAQKVDLDETDKLRYSDEWSKYTSDYIETGSEIMPGYFNDRGGNFVCYYNSNTKELRIKMENSYGALISKNFNN